MNDRVPGDTTAVGGSDLPGSATTFEFSYEGAVGRAARVVTRNGRLGHVRVSADTLTARYGPWVVRTPLENIVEATISGPFRWYKVIGPPHLSFSDRGLTFGTNARQGVCLSFRDPVVGIEPTGRLLHPGLTVTVADCRGLMRAVGF